MARDFNGSSDEIIVGTDIFNSQTKGTISAWVKGDDYSAPFNVFCVSENSNDSTVEIWWVRIINNGGNNRLEVFRRNGPTYSGYGSTNFVNGTEYHIALTSDNTTWKLFVDGSEETVTPLYGGNDGAWWDHIITTGNYDYRIGTLQRGTTFLNYANGIISEVAIYDTDLGLNDIKSLAKGRSPTRIHRQNLIGYWPIQGLSSTEPDLSGNGNNGTVTGTTRANHPPISMLTDLKKASMFTSVSGALSAVSNTLTKLFNISQEVSQTSTKLFNIKNTVSQTSTKLFNIFSEISNTTTHLFNISQAITSTSSHLFNIKETIANTATHLFDIIDTTPVSNTLTKLFNINTEISNTSTHLFNTLSDAQVRTYALWLPRKAADLFLSKKDHDLRI